MHFSMLSMKYGDAKRELKIFMKSQGKKDVFQVFKKVELD